ncbi:leptin receptor overlapping transcript-like 1 [Patiria miniata]|uniref:Leptin receptor overlapping transcript-like 1 n=1 Tax=Patiria miniata TaxID=46514 RepID=A0A913ZXR2_PATMI|nr:leptin receptor overlapping transcript-like 1 [Patiria miniata]
MVKTRSEGPHPICLVALAFSASIGILLVVLSCALPTWSQQWWPMFVVTFYVLSPVPMLVGNRISNIDSLGAASSALRELCIFLTTGIVVSAYGLPLVFAHTGVIELGPALLVLAGNTWCFVTILMFFIIFNRNDDFEFQVW